MTPFLRSVTLVGLAFTCALSGGLHAQRATSIGIGAGATVADGGSGVGFYGVVNAQRSLGDGPFSLRLEGALHRSGLWASNQNVTANVVLAPSWSGPRPYLLAGLGTYIGSGTGAQFGTNAGVGADFRIANVSAFTEVRVHVFRRRLAEGGFRSSAFVPLTFGLRF